MFYPLAPDATPTPYLQNAKHIEVLGAICSEFNLLPTSVELEVETQESTPLSGGSCTEICQGILKGSENSLVAIKLIRTRQKDLKKAKEVSRDSSCEVHRPTQFLNSLETGTDVEGTIPPERPTIPGRYHTHESCSTRPRL